MLLPYKLSKKIETQTPYKTTVNLDNLKFLKTFIKRFQNYLFIGKVDQNIKKKRQQEYLNALSHPFFLRTAKAIPMIFRNTFNIEWKYYESELHFKTASFSKDDGQIPNTEYWNF